MQSPVLNQPRRWKSLERGAESAVRDEVWRGSLPWSLAILSEDSAEQAKGEQGGRDNKKSKKLVS